MTSALSNHQTFSCALDSFLEIASCLFLSHISNLTDDILTESPENSKLLEEIKEPL